MVKINVDDLLWCKLKKDFLVVKETISRMGIGNANTKTLYQSCHVLHKQGRYAIVHFKELFALDGKENDFSEDDAKRRNKIASLLQEWGIIEVINPERFETEELVTYKDKHLKIIKASEKDDWDIRTKYDIGSQNKNFRDKYDVVESDPHYGNRW